MVFPRARLAVSACLFVAWLTFLAYLVAITRDPVVLSRPQLLVSSLHVLASIIDDAEHGVNRRSTVRGILWSSDQEDKKLVGSEISIANLDRLTFLQGWRGPGVSYVIPLVKRKMGDEISYLITPLPITPGFTPQFYAIELVSPGDDKSRVAAAIGAILKIDPIKAEKIVDEVPHRIASNIPAAEVQSWKGTFGKLGAVIQEHAEEVRIYEATSATLSQVNEINFARRRQ